MVVEQLCCVVDEITTPLDEPEQKGKPGRIEVSQCFYAGSS